jgi:ATP-dependent helicase/nuclease subunit A
MSTLQIYKASAGSGKTFTITREFVQLLFKTPFDYRHLLAVTFTNKATAEMKGRIIKTLYALWKEPIVDNKPDYMAMLIEQEGSEKAVRDKAAFILNLLLNDFSRFTVSTIDSFFQRIIRSFFQELGLHSGFKTELDNKKILQLAIDRLIMQLGQPNRDELRRWLIKSSQENMESGQSWDVAKQLKGLGQEVLSEIYQSFQLSYLEKLNDKTLLDAYKKELSETVNAFEQQIKQFGSQGMAMIKAQNLNWEDFPSKSRTPFKIVAKMADLADGYDDFSKIAPFINNFDVWVGDKKNARLKDQMSMLYQAGLNKLLGESNDFIQQHILLYNTASLILKNINALAIINDIANEMDQLCQEESVFLLSNSNRLLYKVIGNNDAPFVYEKCGSTYKHFMIDEFQDTSSLQWNNFRPLIENSLAAGNFAMVVGDVKQSIYRWRNSDWKLLADQIENDFTVLGTKTSTLDTNWRSSENVIKFNNRIFTLAAKHLQSHFNEKLANVDEELANQWRSKIEHAYGDVAQNITEKNTGTGGYINLMFLEAKDDEESYDDRAVKQTMLMIKSILDNGFAYKDICVLVRKTDEANLITNALLSGEHLGFACPVVSNEALMLSGSVAVNMLVNQLKFILNPENDIYKAYILLYSQSIITNSLPTHIDANQIALDNTPYKELLSFKGLPLLDLVELLVRRLPESRLKEESVFLQAFIDSTNDFVKNETADLAGFLSWWDDEGCQKSVSVPEEQDAIRVMTVHKSKGLEFEHVVMPFLDWDLNSSRHSSFIWCRDPFGKLDFVPIRYDSKMLDSRFAAEYFNELLHQYVDNLNILYVAFTRAKQSLQGIVPVATGGKSSTEKMSNVSHLLLSLLSSQTQQFGDGAQLSDDGFTLGALSKKKDTGKTTNDTALKTGEFATMDLPRMKSWDYADRVRIFMESENFTDGITPNQVSQGKIMHRLFEMIRNVNDVDDAVARLVLDGLLDRERLADTVLHINGLLSQQPMADWFSPSTKTFNETSILFQKQVLRPDRVVVQDNKATVIDYKFGETHTSAHLQQVRNYMQLIKKMGYQTVDGYVWYVTENKVVNVPFNGQLDLFA